MKRPSSKTLLDLLEPIRDSLYRYARRAAWRAEDVDDILQEATMTGWRELGRFQLGTNFRAWMFRILVNTVYRFNKRSYRKREVAFEEGKEDVFVSLEREDAWSVLLDHPDKLSELLDERLAASIDRLRPNERQCLLLRLLEGFSYKEISAMLSIPVGTVMSHVHRSRMRMREELASLAVEQGLIKEAV